jgi:phospholipase C
LPTSTAPNRLMSMCGDTTIDETGTFLPDMPNVYEWLNGRSVRWRVYSAGLPFMALMPRVAPLIATDHFRRLDGLQSDILNEADSTFPQVIFIEPDYFDSPIHFNAPCPTPCDNHPPLAIASGEAFLGLVYQWLSSNRDRWAHTVLVVAYDEHGGFFDHVAPLGIPYRNGGVAFDSTGPRVPAIVAGPFAPPGVSKTLLDNTSILQMLAERFGTGAPYSSTVAARARTVGSVSSVLRASAGNTSVASVAPPSGAGGPSPAGKISPLRTAFEGACQRLSTNDAVLQKFPELGSGS